MQPFSLQPWLKSNPSEVGSNGLWLAFLHSAGILTWQVQTRPARRYRSQNSASESRDLTIISPSLARKKATQRTRLRKDTSKQYENRTENSAKVEGRGACPGKTTGRLSPKKKSPFFSRITIVPELLSVSGIKQRQCLGSPMAVNHFSLAALQKMIDGCR
jgi:hypothetical protein